jgi:hypothetical protein
MAEPAKAREEFRRMLKLIAVSGVVLTAGALWYLSIFGIVTAVTVTATIFGVFISVALGCGLFAAAFFSSKSGHDQDVTDSTRRDL